MRIRTGLYPAHRYVPCQARSYATQVLVGGAHCLAPKDLGERIGARGKNRNPPNQRAKLRATHSAGARPRRKATSRGEGAGSTSVTGRETGISEWRGRGARCQIPEDEWRR